MSIRRTKTFTKNKVKSIVYLNGWAHFDGNMRNEFQLSEETISEMLNKQ